MAWMIYSSMTIRETACRTILSRSGIPGVDYAVNPYVGCGHGCLYCYAIFMKRFTDHREPWGKFVDAKVNCAIRLKKELPRARDGEVFLSSVTDPYQPAERHYQLTRSCLEVLQQVQLPVSILTKSDLVLRDLDLLKKMKRVEVGMSITTLDEKVRAFFEPGSSPTADRLKAIKTLSDNRIQTWVFFGPVLPYFSDTEEAIDAVLREAVRSGAQSVLIDRMNLYPEVWKRMEPFLKQWGPEVLSCYHRARQEKRSYSEALRERVGQVVRRHGLECKIVF